MLGVVVGPALGGSVPVGPISHPGKGAAALAAQIFSTSIALGAVSGGAAAIAAAAATVAATAAVAVTTPLTAGGGGTAVGGAVSAASLSSHSKGGEHSGKYGGDKGDKKADKAEKEGKAEKSERERSEREKEAARLILAEHAPKKEAKNGRCSFWFFFEYTSLTRLTLM